MYDFWNSFYSIYLHQTLVRTFGRFFSCSILLTGEKNWLFLCELIIFQFRMDRDPIDRNPQTEIPLGRDPLNRDPHSRTKNPAPWTETPWTENPPPGQRPARSNMGPETETPLEGTLCLDQGVTSNRHPSCEQNDTAFWKYYLACALGVFFWDSM